MTNDEYFDEVLKEYIQYERDQKAKGIRFWRRYERYLRDCKRKCLTGNVVKWKRWDDK